MSEKVAVFVDIQYVIKSAENIMSHGFSMGGLPAGGFGGAHGHMTMPHRPDLNAGDGFTILRAGGSLERLGRHRRGNMAADGERSS